MVSAPEDFHGAVTYAANQCRQQLLRTLFSHRVVADVLEHTSDGDLGARYGSLLADALGGDLSSVNRLEPMLAQGHLQLQQHYFEAFLGRLAAAKWSFHTSEVLNRWGQPIRLSPIGYRAGPRQPAHELAEHNIPRSGLTELAQHLRTILGVQRPFHAWSGLDRRIDAEGHPVHLWSQLMVGFQIRRLYRIADGRVDQAFRNAMMSHWPGCSWQSWSDAVGLDRRDDAGLPVQVPVRQVDVMATTATMLEAVPAVAAAVAGTGAGQQAG